MNDVALIPVHELRANLTLSHGLAWWICAVEDGADLPDSLPADIVAEARRLAVVADDLLRPVPQTHLRKWLALLAVPYLYAGRPRTREESATWSAAMVEGHLGRMPMAVFTMANLDEIQLNNTFFPMPKAFDDVLGRDRDQLERRANALRLVAGRG